jgi:zinc transport system substrate-binding protein
MWRSRLLLPALAVALVSACSPTSGDAGGRLRVTAAAYPLAEAVRWVGGDRVAVTDLTPPGTEPHDLELTTTQVDRVLDADLAVVVGGGFQPAVEDAAARRTGPTLTARRVAGAAGADPHLWLDPVAMRALVAALSTRLADLDPAHADGYRRRAARADARLRALDRSYAAALGRCERRIVVTTHAAFGRLARRYGFRVASIAGIAPDQEPDPRRLAQLAALVRRSRVPVVFTEELVPPGVARTLARETGVPTEVLSPIEGLTPSERRSGADYWSLMAANLGRLARAMGCVSR